MRAGRTSCVRTGSLPSAARRRARQASRSASATGAAVASSDGHAAEPRGRGSCGRRRRRSGSTQRRCAVQQDLEEARRTSRCVLPTVTASSASTFASRPMAPDRKKVAHVGVPGATGRRRPRAPRRPARAGRGRPPRRRARRRRRVPRLPMSRPLTRGSRAPCGCARTTPTASSTRRAVRLVGRGAAAGCGSATSVATWRPGRRSSLSACWRASSMSRSARSRSFCASARASRLDAAP